MLSIGWKSISIFSVNGKEKIAFCACENENSKVSQLLSIGWKSISIFSVNGKEKIALCAYENENSKVSHFEW